MVVISSFRPSGIVAWADNWADCVRKTTHGEGEMEMAETALDEEDVSQPTPNPQTKPTASSDSNELIDLFMFIFRWVEGCVRRQPVGAPLTCSLCAHWKAPKRADLPRKWAFTHGRALSN
jgi:hypothetical protein